MELRTLESIDFSSRYGHDCISYLTTEGEAGVAMVVGGADGEGQPVLSSEIFDFSQGKFVIGPRLPEGNLKVN